MTFEQIQAANKQIKTTPINSKEYAQVQERIKAFRMLMPMGSITSELLSSANNIWVVKATVKDEYGAVLGTGLAYEKEGANFINKNSALENCETSAVGRALAMCGIGIDTSVASYEEVANAIEQGKINPDQKAKLLHEFNRTKVDLEETLKAYKVSNIDDMPEETYKKIMKRMEKTPDAV